MVPSVAPMPYPIQPAGQAIAAKFSGSAGGRVVASDAPMPYPMQPTGQAIAAKRYYGWR